MRACSFSFFFSHQTPAHLYTLSLHDALPISITVTLTLDGTGKVDVKTGLGFLDHLLEALSRHARFDVTLACEGDLHVDDHHTAEDCALALGQALDRALGERRGVKRFGWAYAPLGEALARPV